MNYQEVRLSKLREWEAKQGVAYPDSFEVQYNTVQARELPEDGKLIKVAGRIMLMRVIGKLAFAQLKDFHGKIQLAFKVDTLGQETFAFYEKNLDLGDIVGVEGELFTTNKGEKTIEVHSFTLLSKCLHPLPEKWHGLVDEEQCLRQRYLDLLVNDHTLTKFKMRNTIISTIRNYLQNNQFIEVETPILQKQASGALATPFQTHHKALDIPLFMRIAPETYLKRLIVGGYERVFEIGKSFRNEGVDSSHLQEFTMLEFYCAYWNYHSAIEFVENIFKTVFSVLNIDVKNVQYLEHTIDFSFPWEKITYRDLVLKYTGLDLELYLDDEEELLKQLSKFIDVREYKSLASAIDALYKKLCRPNLINPCIVTNQPAVLGPLARMNDAKPMWSDRFQVVVCGLEIVNSYSELVDPIKQRTILEKQKELSKKGEEEAMEMEDDFLLAMEYGMTPMAGVGIGIDRVISLITNSNSLRDVVFFPSLR